ncbi:hypothetical protein [Variovorax sp. TBS-050B]|uniref:hypothetical protein n=1 Tax=Variovorax sp. TBS-050B TaxID=2940551 RepID=UPI0024755AC8|nr:hypothetical protein [Variovorax sp. TBS-050B]
MALPASAQAPNAIEKSPVDDESRPHAMVLFPDASALKPKAMALWLVSARALSPMAMEPYTSVVAPRPRAIWLPEPDVDTMPVVAPVPIAMLLIALPLVGMKAALPMAMDEFAPAAEPGPMATALPALAVLKAPIAVAFALFAKALWPSAVLLSPVACESWPNADALAALARASDPTTTERSPVALARRPTAIES